MVNVGGDSRSVTGDTKDPVSVPCPRYLFLGQFKTTDSHTSCVCGGIQVSLLFAVDLRFPSNWWCVLEHREPLVKNTGRVQGKIQRQTNVDTFECWSYRPRRRQNTQILTHGWTSPLTCVRVSLPWSVIVSTITTRSPLPVLGTDTLTSPSKTHTWYTGTSVVTSQPDIVCLRPRDWCI